MIVQSLEVLLASQVTMFRLNISIRVLLIAIFSILSANIQCLAETVFCSNGDGLWRVYYQVQFRAKPVVVIEGATGTDASAPAFAPGKKRIVYEIQGEGIQVYELKSNISLSRVNPPDSDVLRPVWHPRNRELTVVKYVVDSKGEDADIFIMDENLEKIRPLVRQTGIQDFPDFSPDGRYLAYCSAQTVSLHRGGVQVVQQIWVMDLETGIARQIMLSNAQDTHPDWSSSGEKIAFASDRSGQFEIWTVNTDGSDAQQLTSGEGAKTWPAWSPDGKSIMFTLAKDGRYSLWIIDIDGSNLRRFEPFGPDSDVQMRDADWR